MNLSVSLTLLRILFVPLVVVLLLAKGPQMDLWAAGIFLLSATTDLLDGYFARRREQVTKLGIMLDPIADKILTSAAFICLVELHLVPAWMVVVIVGREFAVSGLRGIASVEGFIIEPSQLGKTKMVLQVLAITALVLEPRFAALHLWAEGLLWLVVLFALVSATQYFVGFWKESTGRSKLVEAPRLVVLPATGKEQEETDVAAQ
ncbi:MAG TPA: CDP-diacylglycerol--glycerol-3-phosphate 3-phosphatidyltransferase [Terriglobia bacterium]|nr:CDP-diacylglycerol--glycerol-3-phosphate 3-phosphatidyltransferase [Terriglobia bacterium]